MEAPERFKGMKKVKEYPNHVLYEREIEDIWGNKNIIRECFQYYDLGFTTKQIKYSENKSNYLYL